MRPKTPPLDRLAKLIDVTREELLEELEQWPDEPYGGCRAGPEKLWLNGKAQEPMRVLFEIMFEEPMHESWRLRRYCPTPHCSNPLHWRLVLHRLLGAEWRMLPVKLKTLRSAPDDIEDAIDVILMVDGGREMTAEQLHARWTNSYPLELFEEALARIHAEGL